MSSCLTYNITTYLAVNYYSTRFILNFSRFKIIFNIFHAFKRLVMLYHILDLLRCPIMVPYNSVYELADFLHFCFETDHQLGPESRKPSGCVGSQLTDCVLLIGGTGTSVCFHNLLLIECFGTCMRWRE